MKSIQSVEISPSEDQKFESLDGETLFQAKWRVPVIAGRSKPAGRINRHYSASRRFFAQYVENVLILQAKRQKAFYDKFSFPFLPHGMDADYTVTSNGNGILSLYTDRYEYAGGVNGFTVRHSDTWSLESGFPLHVNMNKYKRVLLRMAESQAVKRRESGESVYYEPLRHNLRRYWKPEQWYFTDEGLAIFFAQVTIAPRAEGIPVFVLPYEEIGEVKGLKALQEKSI